MSAVMQQRTPSNDIGFTTGVKYAEQTKGYMLSSVEMPVAAHNYYVQASRSITVEQTDFEQGWRDGYQAFFDGII
jgi:hypothetical protein